MNGKLKIASCLLSSTLCASPHPLPPMFSVTLWALQSSVQLPAHAAHNRCSSAKCIHRHTLTCQCFQFVYKEILLSHFPSFWTIMLLPQASTIQLQEMEILSTEDGLLPSRNHLFPFIAHPGAASGFNWRPFNDHQHQWGSNH